MLISLLETLCTHEFTVRCTRKRICSFTPNRSCITADLDLIISSYRGWVFNIQLLLLHFLSCRRQRICSELFWCGKVCSQLVRQNCCLVNYPRYKARKSKYFRLLGTGAFELNFGLAIFISENTADRNIIPGGMRNFWLIHGFLLSHYFFWLPWILEQKNTWVFTQDLTCITIRFYALLNKPRSYKLSRWGHHTNKTNAYLKWFLKDASKVDPPSCR